MIRLEQVVKRYKTHGGPHTVLDRVDLKVPKGEKIGILGLNGAGKSTLIRIISGAELPNSGRVIRQMSVSWPLAFGGAFQGSLTGLDNIRFIFRVYGKDFKQAIAFIQEFSELGKFLREPVKNYSSGMRARLAFAISMAIEFDCFLIDEVISVGDAKFHQKCERELFNERGDRAMIIVSHDPAVIRQHCNRACVLSSGRLYEFDEMDAAYEQYSRLVKVQ